MGHRPHINNAEFTMLAVKEARKSIVCPLPLNPDEYALYEEIYAQRLGCEWSGAEMRMICELARLSIQVDHLSLKMAQQGFVDPDLALYERLCKIRDKMRVTLKLNIVSMMAKTFQAQKSAADKIVNNIGGRQPTASANPVRINWEDALNV